MSQIIWTIFTTNTDPSKLHIIYTPRSSRDWPIASSIVLTMVSLVLQIFISLEGLVVWSCVDCWIYYSKAREMARLQKQKREETSLRKRGF